MIGLHVYAHKQGRGPGIPGPRKTNMYQTLPQPFQALMHTHTHTHKINITLKLKFCYM